MEERKRFSKRFKKPVEYKSSLGRDEMYEYREFYANPEGEINAPEEWERLYCEGNTALYRRKRPKLSK